ARVLHAIAVTVLELDARDRAGQDAAEVAEDIVERAAAGGERDGDAIGGRFRLREAGGNDFVQDVSPGLQVSEKEVARGVRHRRQRLPGGRLQLDRNPSQARLARVARAVGIQVLELDPADRVGDRLVSNVQAGRVPFAEVD